jgi:hypothetical protein
MNHSEKFKIENCDKISGTIIKVEKSYAVKSRSHQDGWMIELKEVNYTIRVVGEYYSAINHDNFKRLIKPGAVIDVYFLKSKYYGLFEKMNDNFGVKDAATIMCSGTEILDFESIRGRLSHLFIMNLVFGLVAVGLGIKMIIESMKLLPTKAKTSG